MSATIEQHGARPAAGIHIESGERLPNPDDSAAATHPPSAALSHNQKTRFLSFSLSLAATPCSHTPLPPLTGALVACCTCVRRSMCSPCLSPGQVSHITPHPDLFVIIINQIACRRS